MIDLCMQLASDIVYNCDILSSSLNFFSCVLSNHFCYDIVCR